MLPARHRHIRGVPRTAQDRLLRADKTVWPRTSRGPTSTREQQVAEAAVAMSGAGLAREAVYVYGSDLAGAQQGESASLAVHAFGASPAQVSGPSGHTYALPCANSAGEPFEAGVLKNYVQTFFSHARAHEHTQFHVSRLTRDTGHGADTRMAGLFAGAPANCQLPGLWSAILDARQPTRLLIFDPGARLAEAAWQQRLQRYLALNQPLWGGSTVELVSVGLARTLVANDMAARKLGLGHRVIGPNENAFGRLATGVAEHKAIWYSTRLLCIVDFDQTAQPQQVRMMGAATRSGLPIDQLDTAESN